MAQGKVVLAYSGGLDTSVMVPWIRENYDLDVVTFTCDLGQGTDDLEAIRRKALATGAVAAEVLDARALFLDYFVLPSLMANALYEGVYPLSTALGRPLIAWLMVDVAKRHGATHVAHGCTGKGNDQVRFDVTFQTLAPELQIIAPVREWKMSRPQAIQYAQDHGVPVTASLEKPYSVDQNLWGRSVECGALEDPWNSPPAGCYDWTVDPADAPAEGRTLTVGFEAGRPKSLDGAEIDPVELVLKLNRLGGAHGCGRLDLVENRLVGIKSREVYECPGALVLIEAHKKLEQLCLSKPCQRFKNLVAQEYADVVYNGLWFSAFHQDLMAFIASSQRYVTGEVRVRLHQGRIVCEGARSEYSLYSKDLATYESGDQFDHESALGFIRLWGLSQQTQARQQALPGTKDMQFPRITPPSA